MQVSPRVEKNLKKFAHVIGGEDDNHVQHRRPDDAQLKEHLFFLKNREMDGASGEFMLGHIIRGKIIDGIYDIEYVGLNRHTRKPRKDEAITKDHQKVLDRVEVLKERQDRDIIQGKLEHLESMGIFTTEEELRESLTK